MLIVAKETREPDGVRLEFVIRDWMEGEYDLIRWSKTARTRIARAVLALKSQLLLQRYSIGDFWLHARQQSKGECENHGAA
jgi:hypothetical protein